MGATPRAAGASGGSRGVPAPRDIAARPGLRGRRHRTRARLAEGGRVRSGTGGPMNLPIALTLFRIVLVPLLILFLISSDRVHVLIAAVIFIAASLTDWLDGW